MREATFEYYDRRAAEYDETSWEQSNGADESVRLVLSTLPPASTLDIGCGTGYVSRWLPGSLTLMDASSSMLSIAKRRRPDATIVRASAPSLPFPDRTFGRAFAANLYGHLPLHQRVLLVGEMRRVAAELVVLEQVAGSGSFSEGPERRQLLDGSEFVIHKCYFTVERLLEELGGGEILMAGPEFAIIRRLSTE
ncbi:MAG TPA: class I SAM-dependent methyltransferase [Chloroflexota bacterium]|nr:class I SAM-dependent methyltransferase [Chloroflexota bacterium]